MRVVKPITFNNLSFERESEATYYNSSGLLTTAAVDELRNGYNPTTLGYIGPIFEGEATNHIIQSNNFVAPWVFTNAASSGASYTGPDGAISATQINPSGPYQPTISQNVSISVGAGGALVYSVYVQWVPSETFNFVSLSLSPDGMTAGIALFDIDMAVVAAYGGGAIAGIQALQNGWRRCWVAMTTPSAISSANVNISLPAPGVFRISRAQLEIAQSASSKPTSYFGTDSESATRAADVQNSPPSMVSSNISEPDHDEWEDDFLYSSGAVVTVLGNYNRNYKCVNSITMVPAQPPYIDTANWIDIGATNRWRMFDNNVGADLQTINSGTVDVTLALASRINTIALFNLIGKSVTVRMFYGGNVIFEQTVSLIKSETNGWWSFFFGNKRQAKTVAFTNIPPAPNATVQIIVDGGTGTAAIGKAVLGYGKDLGFAEYGTTSCGIIDYSTKEVDQFGNYYFLERRFVDTMDLKIVVDPGRETIVKNTLSEGRAKPYVYIGEDGFETLIILGRYMDFSILFSTPAASYCSMRIEGI